MSYQKHPEFITPPEETKIFRYMSFEKFLALLETQTLFFPSLDILAKQDIYEGEYSDVNKATDNITWAGLPQDSKDQFKTEKMFNKYKELKKQNRQFIRNQRKIIFANCWHMQEHESAAMWKTYTQNQKGIAVTSTVGKFINSLRDYKDFNVMIGGIDYLDFSVHAVNEGNMLIPFMCKRRFFDYEKELRALIWTAENGKNPIEAEKNPYSLMSGISVPVDIKSLISEVIVSPETEVWEYELLLKLLQRYGIDIPIKPSKLSFVPTP